MGLRVYWLGGSGESWLVRRFIVDIPQLGVNGIQVGDACFERVYSLQSSSKNWVMSLQFDANGLESVIKRLSQYLV